MIIAKSYDELCAERAKISGKLSVVPTMGALHDGHLSLIDLARKDAKNVAATLFVNPTQFAPHEDLDSYPRPLDSDLEKFESKGVDLVYVPQVSDIYPEGTKADRQAGPSAHGLESDFRPHFFDGVVSVVWRLFDHIKPDSAVFGEKDYQQMRVIQEMVEQDNLNIDIIPAPIIRDDDGLALSSRNAYLSDEKLNIARQLNVILKQTAHDIKNEKTSSQCLDLAKKDIIAAGFNAVDYLDIRWGRLLVAAHIGSTRLIDNVTI